MLNEEQVKTIAEICDRITDPAQMPIAAISISVIRYGDSRIESHAIADKNVNYLSLMGLLQTQCVSLSKQFDNVQAEENQDVD